MEPIYLLRSKDCSCGEKHWVIPETATFNEQGFWMLDGWYWHCLCGSTQLMRKTDLDSFLEPATNLKAA